MRLIFHIGAPKTGSTAIQAAIFEAGPSLLASGVYLLGGDASHHTLMLLQMDRLLLPERSFDAERRRLVAAHFEQAKSMGCHTLLASSELAFTPTVAEAFLDATPSDTEAIVVAYLRHQRETVPSYFIQEHRTARNGGRTLPDVVDQFLNAPDGYMSERLDTLVLHPRVRGLQAFSYRDHRADVIHHFGQVLRDAGCGSVSLRPQHHNTSPLSENLALLSALDYPRVIDGDNDLRFPPRVRVAQTLSDHPLGQPVRPLPRNLDNLITERYRVSNLRLAQRYGVDLERHAPNAIASPAPEADTAGIGDPETLWPTDVSTKGITLLLHAVLRVAFEIWNAGEREWVPVFENLGPASIDWPPGETTQSLSQADQLNLEDVCAILGPYVQPSDGGSEKTFSKRLVELLGYFIFGREPRFACDPRSAPQADRRFNRAVIEVVIRAGSRLQWEAMAPENRNWEVLIETAELNFIRSPWPSSDPRMAPESSERAHGDGP